MSGDRYETTEFAPNRNASGVLHRLARTLKEDAEWMLSALDQELDEVASVLRADAEWVLQALDQQEWDAQLGPRSRRMFRMMVLFSVLGNRDRDMLLAITARLAQGKVGKAVVGDMSGFCPAPRQTGRVGGSAAPCGRAPCLARRRRS